MADLEFNRGDIEGLTQKVAGLWPNLSAQERALLLAIFASAAETPVPPVRTSQRHCPRLQTLPGHYRPEPITQRL